MYSVQLIKLISHECTCCWCETEFAVDSHHWRLALLLVASAMEMEKIDLSTSL